MSMARLTPLVVLVALGGAPFARAQAPAMEKNESSITVYGGDRFGGSLTDTATNSSINLQNGSSFAAAVDIGLDRNTQVELFYSQQNTALAAPAFSAQGNNTGRRPYNTHGG